MQCMASRDCWRCGVRAHMTLIIDPVADPYDVRRSRLQGMFKCDECATLQIGMVVVSNDNLMSTNVRESIEALRIEWWPKRVGSPSLDDVPDHIAATAREAWECFSFDAYRAAGALARTVVEATAKAKGIDTGHLHSKIESLQSAGHIRPHITQAAHEIRFLGNEIAHGDFVHPIERDEAEEVLVLMSEVLQEVFQSPARIARRRAAREARSAPPSDQ